MLSRSTAVRPRLRVLAVVAALASAPFLGACEDDPFGFNDWTLAPDTVFIYSLARPELNLASGFNVNQRRLVRVEAAGATGSWDFLVNTEDGRLVFLTPSAVGLDTESAVVPMPGETFDGIREAPADTALYVRDRSVPIELGQLYVVRTNQQTGSFGRRCVYYGKLEPLEVDPVGGTLRFRYDASPLCNSRSLVPPEG
ncbi:MAG: hypothetical protein KJO11_02500 [Gemmatimonadetes bacterium]|nr:hypothetical protein [Gemmatimonadota bacterium]